MFCGENKSNSLFVFLFIDFDAVNKQMKKSFICHMCHKAVQGTLKILCSLCARQLFGPSQRDKASSFLKRNVSVDYVLV